MLSYQHAYHAGGPADVHKHTLLWLALQRLAAKDKPFAALDLHAAEGLYDLARPEAEKTGEYRRGIARLRGTDTPHEIAGYLDLITALNPDGPLLRYPGSPEVMRATLRPDDRLILNELHPAAATALRRWARNDPRVAVHRRDAIEALGGLTPPPIRRGLVLIDPSYEVKDEYAGMASAVTQAAGKWREGVYMIWYPILADARHAALVDGIAGIGLPTVISELMLDTRGLDDAPGLGLRGSGVVVVNPPWQFDIAANTVGTWLARHLGDGPAAGHTLRWLTPQT